MNDSARHSEVYEGKLIEVRGNPNGGFYASIGAVDGEVEGYISRSESVEEALRVAKSFVDAQRIVV